jgi:Zinc finger, C2H2 type
LTFAHPNIEPLSLEQFDDSSFLNLTELITEESAAIEQTTEPTRKPVRGKKKKQPIKKNVAKKSLKTTKTLKSTKSKAKDEEFECIDCNLLFPTQNKHVIHRKLKHPEMLTKKDFKFIEQRDRNYAKLKKLGKTLVSCPHCGKMLKRASLYSHIAGVHIRKKKFYCDTCGKGYFKKSNLESHIFFHIPIELRERNHVCSVCSKGFFHSANLQVHFRHSHTDAEEKEWTCECGKSFARDRLLRAHKYNVHNKEAQRKTCEQCGKVCMGRANLNRHIKIFHTDNGRGNFVCSDCGKRFDQKKELTSHVRSHFEQTTACDEPGCGKFFRCLYLMEQHKKRVHSKVKDYILCDRANCGKAFTGNAGLKQHIKLVHEKHRVKCPVEDCKYMIGRRDYMRTHIRKHTELEPEIFEKLFESVKRMPII